MKKKKNKNENSKKIYSTFRKQLHQLFSETAIMKISAKFTEENLWSSPSFSKIVGQDFQKSCPIEYLWTVVSETETVVTVSEMLWSRPSRHL